MLPRALCTILSNEETHKSFYSVLYCKPDWFYEGTGSSSVIKSLWLSTFTFTHNYLEWCLCHTLWVHSKCSSVVLFWTYLTAWAHWAGFRELTMIPSDSCSCQWLCCHFNIFNQQQTSQQSSANIGQTVHTTQIWATETHRYSFTFMHVADPFIQSKASIQILIYQFIQILTQSNVRMLAQCAMLYSFSDTAQGTWLVIQVSKQNSFE